MTELFMKLDETMKEFSVLLKDKQLLPLRQSCLVTVRTERE